MNANQINKIEEDVVRNLRKRWDSIPMKHKWAFYLESLSSLIVLPVVSLIYSIVLLYLICSNWAFEHQKYNEIAKAIIKMGDVPFSIWALLGIPVISAILIFISIKSSHLCDRARLKYLLSLKDCEFICEGEIDLHNMLNDHRHAIKDIIGIRVKETETDFARLERCTIFILPATIISVFLSLVNDFEIIGICLTCILFGQLVILFVDYLFNIKTGRRLIYDKTLLVCIDIYDLTCTFKI